MSYLVIARKFRPKTFAEVSGQSTAVQTLQNALRSGRIAHAFCFAGPRGVGKTTTARLLAKALNCAKGPTDEPCAQCDACTEAASGHSMDVMEIDGASNGHVDDVQRLRESIQYNPVRDRFKVVIIDEVHMLSKPAFNALLKTLEEPPPHVKFIFATTELHKVPPTILSRCQVYEFRRIPFREMVARLSRIIASEGLKATDDALAMIARNSDGCMRDAESMLDQVVAFGGDELTEELVRSVLGLIGSDILFSIMDGVLQEDSAKVLHLLDRVVDGGADPRRLAARIAEHIRNLLVTKIATTPSEIVAASDAELERLRRQAELLSEDEGLRLLNLVAQAEESMRRTEAPRFTLEMVLLKLVQARRLTPLPRLLEALGVGSSTAVIGSPEAATKGPSVVVAEPVVERPSVPPPTKVESAKVEAVKVESAKVEPFKVEPAKVESAKVEPFKVEPAKVEPAKVEPAKVEPAKVEPAKVEPSQAARSQSESTHDVAPPSSDGPQQTTLLDLPGVAPSGGSRRKSGARSRTSRAGGQSGSDEAPPAANSAGSKKHSNPQTRSNAAKMTSAERRELVQKDSTVMRLVELFKAEVIEVREPRS